MVDWTVILGQWEIWAYGSLVLATLTSAYLRRDRWLEIGASYLALGWIATFIIYWTFYSLHRDTDAAWGYLGLDLLLCYGFYRLASRATWAGYLLLLHISMVGIHLMAFAMPQYANAYMHALNAAFLISCGIVLHESATGLVRRARAS